MLPTQTSAETHCQIHAPGIAIGNITLSVGGFPLSASSHDKGYPYSVQTP